MQESAYWQERWLHGRTGWDLGAPHPLFDELFAAAVKNGLQPGMRIYSPGCGRAHDGIELARRGFRVVAADFAPEAIAAARLNAARFPDAAVNLELRVEDASLCPPEDTSSYDAIFDRAMLCALRPDLRPGFVLGMQQRLKPCGLFLSIPFTKIAVTPERPAGYGPPFEIGLKEIDALFGSAFRRMIHVAHTNGSCDSVILEETVAIWRKDAL